MIEKKPKTADSGEMRTQFLKYNILEHIIKLGALDEFADIEFLSIQAWLIGRVFTSILFIENGLLSY